MVHWKTKPRHASCMQVHKALWTLVNYHLNTKQTHWLIVRPQHQHTLYTTQAVQEHDASSITIRQEASCSRASYNALIRKHVSTFEEAIAAAHTYWQLVSITLNAYLEIYNKCTVFAEVGTLHVNPVCSHAPIVVRNDKHNNRHVTTALFCFRLSRWCHTCSASWRSLSSLVPTSSSNCSPRMSAKSNSSISSGSSESGASPPSTTVGICCKITIYVLLHLSSWRVYNEQTFGCVVDNHRFVNSQMSVNQAVLESQIAFSQSAFSGCTVWHLDKTCSAVLHCARAWGAHQVCLNRYCAPYGSYIHSTCLQCQAEAQKDPQHKCTNCETKTRCTLAACQIVDTWQTLCLMQC